MRPWIGPAAVGVLVAAQAGCAGAPPPGSTAGSVVVAPPPGILVAPPPPPQPPRPVQGISVCVVQDGVLTTVTAQASTATGDTTVNGQPFEAALHAGAGYAAAATWFFSNEPITVNGRRYEKYGLPRVLGADEVTRTGEYRGVPVFAEAGAVGAPEVVYVPVRPGCEFQPYQVSVKVGARGSRQAPGDDGLASARPRPHPFERTWSAGAVGTRWASG